MKRWMIFGFALMLACGGGDPAVEEASWAFQSGGPDADSGTGVASYDDRSGVTVGGFGGSITLGPGQPGETMLTSLGQDDVFVIRHHPDGLLDWVRHVGTSATVAACVVGRFPDGSLVISGAFEETVTIGVGEPDATSLDSAGHTDLFFARYSADGTLEWARRVGGPGYESPRGVATAADGTWFVTGYFQHTITFGAGEANETALTATGQAETFVAHYDADGSLRWVRGVSGDATCSGHDIAAFPDGSCVAAVRFDGSATFGAGEINETILTSAGSSDVALARYDADGSLAWARRAGSQAVDEPWGVAAFADGSCVVTGSVSGPATFGGGEPNETEIDGAGDWDIFLARYEPDGSLAWVTSAGGVFQDVARDVVGFADGSCAITGRMRDVATFGAGEPGEIQLTSNGEADVFVARYGADGTLLWAENAGGSLIDEGEAICGCGDGTLLVTGRFQRTAVFHEGDDGETTLVSVGGQDVFVALYREDIP